MHAFLVHELGHARLTDFDQADRDPSLQAMTNGIEDVWMERDLGARCQWGGALPLLAEHAAAMWQKDRARGWSGQGTTPIDVAITIAYLGRALTIPEMAQPDAQAVFDGLPAVIRPAVRMALRALPSVDSTVKAKALARRVLARLAQDKAKAEAEAQQPKQEPKKPQEPKPEPTEGKGPGKSQDEPKDEQGDDDSEAEGEGQGESQGEEGNGEGQSQGEGQGQGDADGEAEGESQGESDSEAEGQGQDESQSEGQGGSKAGLGAQQPVEATADLMAELAKRIAERNGAPQDPANMAAAGAIASKWRRTPTIAWQLPEVDPAMAPERFAILQGLARMGGSAILRDTVTRLLRSRDRVGQDRYLTHGRLDRRALPRVMMGASNTQSRRTYVPGQDTAVVLLLDTTGSMARKDSVQTYPIGLHGMHVQPSRAMIANAMAMTFGKAVEAAGADLMLATFLVTDQGKLNGTNGNDPNAIDLGLLGVIKPWHGRMAAAERQLAHFKTHGGTLLAPAVLGAMQELRGRRADRRLIVALTDGACQCSPAAVAEASRMAERAGCEVLGIVVGEEVSDGMAQAMFSEWFRASGPADLNARTLGAVADKLQRALQSPLEAAKRRRASMTHLGR